MSKRKFMRWSRASGSTHARVERIMRGCRRPRRNRLRLESLTVK